MICWFVLSLRYCWIPTIQFCTTLNLSRLISSCSLYYNSVSGEMIQLIQKHKKRFCRRRFKPFFWWGWTLPWECKIQFYVVKTTRINQLILVSDALILISINLANHATISFRGEGHGKRTTTNSLGNSDGFHSVSIYQTESASSFHSFWATCAMAKRQSAFPVRWQRL